MTSTDLNTYVTFGYMACAVVGLVLYVAGPANSSLKRLPFGLLIVVWAAHTAGIGWRWVEAYQKAIGHASLANWYEWIAFVGWHAPLSNLYTSLVFFAWTLGLVLMWVRLKFKAEIIGVVGLPVVFLIMAYSFQADPDIKPIIPALQSNWLVAHVVTCFLGYACFAISFVAAGILLIMGLGGPKGKHETGRRVLDEIIYRSILVGFPMLTVGIITGAIWADYAWGTYWSWDPKETWSLITWLVYAAFLHARFARGWSGTRTAYLSLLGFAAVVFTYLGVNYLPGLHSYF